MIKVEGAFADQPCVRLGRGFRFGSLGQRQREKKRKRCNECIRGLYKKNTKKKVCNNGRWGIYQMLHTLLICSGEKKKKGDRVVLLWPSISSFLPFLLSFSFASEECNFCA